MQRVNVTPIRLYAVLSLVMTNYYDKIDLRLYYTFRIALQQYYNTLP